MNYFGLGLYTIPDVSRITGLPKYSIHRWLKGYGYKYKGEHQYSEKLWSPELDLIDDVVELSFKDLMELKYVQKFKKLGMNMRLIRYAKEYALEKYNTSYPFCTRRFVTDGTGFFEEIPNENKKKLMMNILNRQTEYNDIISFFAQQLEFEDDQLTKWWPMSKERQVIIDPKRNFGHPIVVKEGILTDILSRAYYANGESYKVVSDWYEASEESVRDAVEYERQLAA